MNTCAEYGRFTKRGTERGFTRRAVRSKRSEEKRILFIDGGDEMLEATRMAPARILEARQVISRGYPRVAAVDARANSTSRTTLTIKTSIAI